MEAERRQVTVLFADMVGFTSFSERSGDEAAFSLMRSLANLMEGAVRDEGGAVQGFTGDGIMAVFGAPVAHEDAPLRACRAALAILAKLRVGGDDLEARHGTRPQFRIGVNTGRAIVGQVQGGLDAGVTVMGDTVNVASRLQALAEPGSAVMSEATHRLVEGLVETSFFGDHDVKGKSASQKAYRLHAIREGATRFGAKLHRGLTTFVGRDAELEKLEGGFEAIGSGVRVFDIVGEPGIGKSRLVHEFLGQIVKGRAQVLVGGCTPDGQQTPFRAFIEIVRGAFGLGPGDSEAAIARKLEEGLQGLGLRSSENLALLLNMLGLKAPEGALAGLDGVLIGLRTREMLQTLVQARSRLRPLILVFEDLHWLDSASEDLLAKTVAVEELRLLILHTRRPEYDPPWAAEPRVARLSMEPLSARETSRIAQARLGVDSLPEALAKLIAAKAEGNALFAEEIASFLVERGIVRRTADGLDFDPAAVAAVLPESVHSLLASRVDRLTPADRNLLQAAAVVGRRFDPDLVAVVGDASGTAQASFAAMEAFDLIRRVERSSDYVFKHALVRDALYNGLLSGPRAALHLRVAEELERRGGNRLMEIAETLAHHFSETPRVDRAFAYLAMAGDKSLDIYALHEAEENYRHALKIFDDHDACASSDSVAAVVLRLLEAFVLESDYRDFGHVTEKYLPMIRKAGDSPDLVKALYYQGLFSSYSLVDYHASRRLMAEAHAIAERLGAGRARAYARYGLLLTRSFMGLDTPETGERMSADMMEDSLQYGDNYIRNFSSWMVGQDYIVHGLLKEAREAASQFMKSGEERGDPRAVSLANWLLSLIELAYEAPEAALARAEDCSRFAVTRNEQLWGELARIHANLALGIHDSLLQLDALNLEHRRLEANLLRHDFPRGMALLLSGKFADGIRVLEQEIDRYSNAGEGWFSTLLRVQLAGFYIQVLTAKDKPPPGLVRKNLRTLIGIKLFGARRALALLLEAASSRHLSDRGVTRAFIDFNLGALSAMKKRRAEAQSYFEKARAVAEDQGADKLLQKIDAAMAQLG
ncbi:MAG TPA: AAA family ATPase [Roseiarcus sp.]|nr:AAA family ATPase [Roseiarcus sp.]